MFTLIFNQLNLVFILDHIDPIYDLNKMISFIPAKKINKFDSQSK
jgi:hypothetical protein